LNADHEKGNHSRTSSVRYFKISHYYICIFQEANLVEPSEKKDERKVVPIHAKKS